MKRTVFSVLSVIGIISLLISYTVVSAYYAQPVNEISLTRNFDLEQQIKDSTSRAITLDFAQTDSVNFVISADHKMMDVELTLSGHTYSFSLAGDERYVTTGNTKGWVGVFEGYMIPESGDGLEKKMGTEIPVLIDITRSSNGENFAGITLGTLGSDFIPELYIFGSMTEAISTLSCFENQDLSGENELSPANTSLSSTAAVDAELLLQGYDTSSNSGYTFGMLSIFHAAEARNGGNSTLYVKVNSNSDDVENYLINVSKVDRELFSYVVPDQIEIMMRSTSASFHNVTNSYNLQNAETTLDLTIPVYLGQTLGIQTIPLSVVTSSTQVTSSRYPSSSPYTDNQLSWKFYSNSGFSSTDIDGDYESETGMAVYATYTNESNVNKPENVEMYYTGSIRYKYMLWDVNQGSAPVPYYLHISSGTIEDYSDITIIP